MKKTSAKSARPTGQSRRRAATRTKPAVSQTAAVGKVRLLSGGNPQIPKGDGDVPVQAYIAALPGWKKDVGRWLDELIVRTVPGVRKAVRWNSPFYGMEGQGWFLSYHCMTRYVKITFLRGTSLKPMPPVESKHPDVRYLHIHEGEQPDGKQVAAWIKQAAKLPGDACF